MIKSIYDYCNKNFVKKKTWNWYFTTPSLKKQLVFLRENWSYFFKACYFLPLVSNVVLNDVGWT